MEPPLRLRPSPAEAGGAGGVRLVAGPDEMRDCVDLWRKLGEPSGELRLHLSRRKDEQTRIKNARIQLQIESDLRAFAHKSS